MQIDVIDNGKLGKRLTITYNRDEVLAHRETVLKRLAGEVNLKGFRPGKSSKNVLEKRFGETADARTADELASKGFQQATKQHQLKPIGPLRDQQIDRKNGLTLTVNFEVKPKVALPEPKSLQVTNNEVKLTDDALDLAIQSLARRAGELTDLGSDETIAADDSLTISGTVSCGGKVAREIKDLHHLVGAYPLLGKDAKDVVELLKDKKTGGKFSFSTTLPASFKPDEFAGKGAEVSLTVDKIQRLRAAPFNDELAKKMGVTDAAELKNVLGANMLRNLENQQHQRQLDEMMVDLIAKSTVELPPRLLETMVNERREAELKKLEAGGEDAKKGRDEALAAADKAAADMLKRYLIIDAIAETYQVKVTREDLDQQLAMAAARNGQSVQDLGKKLWESGRINDVMQEIREAKSLETMLDKILGRETRPDTGELIEEHVHGPDCKHAHG
jgi:trigger factor